MTHPPGPQALCSALMSMHVNVLLSTPVDSDPFMASISHCIFKCIVGSENMLLC